MYIETFTVCQSKFFKIDYWKYKINLINLVNINYINMYINSNFDGNVTHERKTGWIRYKDKEMKVRNEK